MWIIGVAGLGLLCSYFTSSLTNEFMSFPMVRGQETVSILVVYQTTLDTFIASIVCNKAFLKVQNRGISVFIKGLVGFSPKFFSTKLSEFSNHIF